MPNAYIIELLGKSVGIIVPDGQGFRFFAAKRAYFALEGRYFKNYAATVKAARALAAGASPRSSALLQD